jgi:hypothetical protein
MAGSREWTVPGPGKYEIRDQAAPSVRSWIVVDPKLAAVAYPTREGTFTFGALAPGEYTLQAYFAGAPVGAPRAVTVGAGDVEVREPLVVGTSKDEKSKDEKSKDEPKPGGKR